MIKIDKKYINFKKKMKSWIIASFLTSVLGSCPPNFIDNPSNSGCLANISSSNTTLTGHDIVNITWNRDLFSDRVLVKLLISQHPRNEGNCYYNYLNVNVNDDYVLSETIDNNGFFTWYIPNYNYYNSDYVIQITNTINLICDLNTGSINQNYAITNEFRLTSNINANFRWIWPEDGNIVNIIPGNTYRIQASGYHHRERYAFATKLQASITNFNPDIPGTWIQADPYPLDYNNIFNTPNWLNWGNYLNGDTEINIPWIIPVDTTAYMRQNGNVYSLTRTNGSLINLADIDVKLRIITKIYIAVRDETNHIIGFTKSCFDHNNNNNCDSHESTAYHSNILKLNSRPTMSPTNTPTFIPTMSPTNTPTLSPTMSPTSNPTSSPTMSPSRNPTFNPTMSPTSNPTMSPTSNPTSSPTMSPTSNPTSSPTNPTFNPTSSPTMSPTSNPI